jgi:hypothetical protein
MIILQEHIKCIIPEQIIDYLNLKIPYLSGMWYFCDGKLMSHSKDYSIYFDPFHRVIEVKKLI